MQTEFLFFSLFTYVFILGFFLLFGKTQSQLAKTRIMLKHHAAVVLWPIKGISNRDIHIYNIYLYMSPVRKARHRHCLDIGFSRDKRLHWSASARGSTNGVQLNWRVQIDGSTSVKKWGLQYMVHANAANIPFKPFSFQSS